MAEFPIFADLVAPESVHVRTNGILERTEKIASGGVLRSGIHQAQKRGGREMRAESEDAFGEARMSIGVITDRLQRTSEQDRQIHSRFLANEGWNAVEDIGG